MPPLVRIEEIVELLTKCLGLQLHDDILLAKMRPGQCIDLEAHAVKGVGSDHAKWSPVATAWYRLQPEVKVKSKIKGESATALVEACPGLFRLEKVVITPLPSISPQSQH